MSEYIIEIPDEYFASYDTKRDMYYPDERDSAMPIAPIVRCKDCIRYSLDYYGNTWCAYVASAVQPDDFCAWGERK